MKHLISVMVASIAAIVAPTAQASDSYPSRPVHMVVPFSAGGIGDVLARIISESISTELGQPVIVENRPGAGGSRGTLQALRADADGYTVLQVASPQIINQALRADPGYDLLKDFSPITRAVRAPLVLVVPGSSPVKSVKDLVALAASRPQGLNFGSGGVGSVGHLSGELLVRSAGISATHIAYQGNAGVIPDLIGGRLDYFFSSQPEAVTGVGSGGMRALAVTAPERVDTFPDVPTMIEAGYPGFLPSSVYGYMAPAGTPDHVVKVLHQAMAKAIASPDVQKRFKTLGLNADMGDPKEWGSTLEAEMDRWKEVGTSANIRLD